MTPTPIYKLIEVRRIGEFGTDVTVRPNNRLLHGRSDESAWIEPNQSRFWTYWQAIAEEVVRKQTISGTLIGVHLNGIEAQLVFRNGNRSERSPGNESPNQSS